MERSIEIKISGCKDCPFYKMDEYSHDNCNLAGRLELNIPTITEEENYKLEEMGIRGHHFGQFKSYPPDECPLKLDMDMTVKDKKVCNVSFK